MGKLRSSVTSDLNMCGVEGNSSVDVGYYPREIGGGG